LSSLAAIGGVFDGRAWSDPPPTPNPPASLPPTEFATVRLQEQPRILKPEMDFRFSLESRTLEIQGPESLTGVVRLDWYGLVWSPVGSAHQRTAARDLLNIEFFPLLHTQLCLQFMYNARAYGGQSSLAVKGSGFEPQCQTCSHP